MSRCTRLATALVSFPSMLLPRLSSIAAGLLVLAAPLSSAPRVEVDLSSGWRFRYGEIAGAEAAAFADAAWDRIDLPHTWNALDGQDGVKDKSAVRSGLRGDYARGTGWYRRSVADRKSTRLNSSHT